jgi:UDP-N-acetylmuramoylalanine--D-glutamate ligase
VFVSDFGKIKTSTNKFLQIMVSTGRMKKHTEALILNADVVMKSPGIPEKSSNRQEAV